MKQLKRIKLNEFVEMTDKEMKFIVGGSGSGSGSSSGSGNGCPSGEAPCTCNGTSYGCKTISGCWDAC